MSIEVEHSILDKFRGLSVQKAVPLQASLELTNRCNERCTHCYLDSFKDDPSRVLKKEDWFKILQELRVAGSLYLILMGGEAMLSPWFWDILKKSQELQFHTSMITNGLKISSQAVASRLKDSGLKVATVSLYSLKPDIHDKMTQVKGSLSKTLSAIEFCQKAGIEVGVNTLLAESNASGIFDLYDWCEQRDLEMKVDPNITPKLGGDLSPTQYRASQKTLEWFYRERARRWPRSCPQPSMEVLDSHVCNAAKGKCAVTAYGELLPCIEIREPMGSLVESSFEEIWRGSVAKKWRDLKVKDLKALDSLEDYNFCEHCPGMAKNENGKALELTDYTKLVGRVKRQVYLEQCAQDRL